MITILLDSSNTNLSVGIARDNLLLESISYEAWQRQSEYMILELDKLSFATPTDRLVFEESNNTVIII